MPPAQAIALARQKGPSTGLSAPGRARADSLPSFRAWSRAVSIAFSLSLHSLVGFPTTALLRA